jgi:hypothetical protein
MTRHDDADGTPPRLLKPGELRRHLGFSRTKFHRLQRAGAFDSMKAPNLAGHYSRPLVDRWLEQVLDEQSGSARYFRRGRKR